MPATRPGQTGWTGLVFFSFFFFGLRSFRRGITDYITRRGQLSIRTTIKSNRVYATVSTTLALNKLIRVFFCRRLSHLLQQQMQPHWPTSTPRPMLGKEARLAHQYYISVVEGKGHKTVCYIPSQLLGLCNRRDPFPPLVCGIALLPCSCDSPCRVSPFVVGDPHQPSVIFLAFLIHSLLPPDHLLAKA